MFITKKKIILASNSPRRQNFLKDIGIKYSLLNDFKNSKSDQIKNSDIGVLAKDDFEARPFDFELPQDYVERMAIYKMFEAIQSGQNLNIINKINELSEISCIDKNELNLSFHLKKYNLLIEQDKYNQDFSETLWITADTIVALDNKILGKPYDQEDALKMLQSLAGREHTVLTSVCVFNFENFILYNFTDKAKVHFVSWPEKLLKAYIKTNDPMDKAGSYGIQGLGIFLSDHIQGSWDTVAGLPLAKLLELLFYCEAITV